MQLFADVHPATLHTVLILCKNDFFRAVDKLLFAKRCKQLYSNKKNISKGPLPSKPNKFPCCGKATFANKSQETIDDNVIEKNQTSSFLGANTIINPKPLDISNKKQVSQNKPLDNSTECVLKLNILHSQNVLKNKLKSKETCKYCECHRFYYTLLCHRSLTKL